MASPPPKSRRAFNVFRDDELAPKGLEGAFVDATRGSPVAEDVPSPPSESASASVDTPPGSETTKSVTAPEPPPAAPGARPRSRKSRLTRSATSETAVERRLHRPSEKNVGFEIRLPQLTKGEFAGFKARLGAALGGIPLTDSHVIRALLESLLVHDAEAILEVAQEQPGPIKRPANQDVLAQAEFDALLSSIVREGQHRSRRRRPPRPPAPEEGAKA